MKTLTGKPVSPGYAHGRAVLLAAHQVDIPKSRIRPEQAETELERFHAALENTQREMQHLQARVHAELGSAAAEIFSAHLPFLRHQQLLGHPINITYISNTNTDRFTLLRMTEHPVTLVRMLAC